MYRPAIDERAAADPRADRDVDKGIGVAAGAPASLAQGRAVHVRIPPDRHAERIAQGTDHISVGPMGLGRGRNVAVGWRGRVEVDGAKRGHAHGTELDTLARASKELDHAPQRLVRRRRGEARLVHHLPRPGAKHAYELGAAPLDSAEHRFHEPAPGLIDDHYTAASPAVRNRIPPLVVELEGCLAPQYNIVQLQFI